LPKHPLIYRSSAVAFATFLLVLELSILRRAQVESTAQFGTLLGNIQQVGLTLNADLQANSRLRDIGQKAGTIASAPPRREAPIALPESGSLRDTAAYLSADILDFLVSRNSTAPIESTKRAPYEADTVSLFNNRYLRAVIETESRLKRGGLPLPLTLQHGTVAEIRNAANILGWGADNVDAGTLITESERVSNAIENIGNDLSANISRLHQELADRTRNMTPDQAKRFASFYFDPGGYISGVHDEASKRYKTEFMDSAINLRSKLVMLVPGVSASDKLFSYQYPINPMIYKDIADDLRALSTAYIEKLKNSIPRQ
jgi:hypothetical protein